MSFLKSITDIGIKEEMPLGLKRRLRVVNLMTLNSLLIGASLTILSFFYLDFILHKSFFIGINVIFISILILNKKGKHIQSRLLYLIASYLVIAFLPILFGPDLNYRYFLVPGVGMALLFFDDEIGWKKWILVGAGIPVWAFQEIMVATYPPIIEIDPGLISILGRVNDIMTLLTAMSMFYIFTNQSDSHIKIIQEQKIALENSNKELEQLAYVVSHDLKAPLRGINSLADMIEEDFPNMDKEMAVLFGKLKERALNMQVLINGILSYSRANSKLEKHLLNPEEIITKVISSIDNPSGIKIECQLSNKPILFNEIQFEQILNNLISNAIKYHDKPNGWIKIKGNQTSISIEDNGPGIDPAYHEKLFELFNTAGKKANENTTGVGLAIVKKLVENNDAKISLESDGKEGSKFIIDFKE